MRDEGIGNIYNIDLLSAMKCIRQFWSSLPPQFIEKCGNHTGLIDYAHTAGQTMSTSNVLSLNIDTDTVGLEAIIQDLVQGPDGMSVKYLLNIDSGKGITEERTEEEYI